MPVVDLTNSTKIPSRWHAQCAHCGEEAFAYVTYFRPEKEFEGAEIYKRGQTWDVITSGMIERGEVVCAHCNKRITADDITVVKDKMTVSALMRLVDNVGKYLMIIREEQTAIARLIEYGFVIQMKPEKWKEMLEKNARNISNIEAVAKGLYASCVGFGDCSGADEPINPTDLIRLAKQSGVPLG
jgi:hypothetical protein